jgi:hypothetical protein
MQHFTHEGGFWAVLWGVGDIGRVWWSYDEGEVFARAQWLQQRMAENWFMLDVHEWMERELPTADGVGHLSDLVWIPVTP